jgi:hypothetical protein
MGGEEVLKRKEVVLRFQRDGLGEEEGVKRKRGFFFK